MFVLRFTQTLLKEMKAIPKENELVSPLFSWHANIIRLNNRKHILFVNDLSRLSVLIEGIRTAQLNGLIDKFQSELFDYLVSEEIEQALINSYMNDGSEVTISKTNSRSVLGTMKEITFYSTDTQMEFADKEELIKWLNRIIYKPIDYEEPIKVFKEAIQRQYM
ncbi:DUF6933 domain-containing protein [Paenibacillus caui]|uniref:DUF6933 domain-containing protein n=1 Tax=Paenibacillus caui TaxID=2873927 RepID=UPI001CA89C64|nr:hypothetical protein [Paenibacillus caui]